MNNKIHTLRFALAGGIWLGLCYATVTLFTLMNIPGFSPVAEFFRQCYGAYGYSISWWGIIVGGVWGFVEGFIHIGFFGWLYNWLNK